jgi:glycosyltransferase involved in cell wall biosynthesis
MAKPKILWVSDLVTPTGFSRVAHGILKHLKDKYEVVGLGVNYRGDPHPYGFPIYPAAVNGNVMGENRLVDILNNVKFDLLFVLNDSWIVGNYLRLIKEAVKSPLPGIVVYFPVDSENHDPDWYANFDMINRAVTYTEFGKQTVNDPTCNPGIKLDIIPHGVDTEIFYRKYTNRKDAKTVLVGKTRDPNSFIFLNANRNQPRKKLDITMEAFSIFAEGKDDVLLHMHCGIRDAHIDVARLAKRLNIDNKLILTNLNNGVQTVPESALNDIYNAADVGINSSMGEGWGLTSMEHAVTGAPQIVPNHSACKELYKDCGLLVPVVTNFTFDNSMTIGKLISPKGLADKMEILYSDKKKYNALSEKSIEKFSDPKYAWSEIAKQWDQLFTECLS